jgi:hypothetical protein
MEQDHRSELSVAAIAKGEVVIGIRLEVHRLVKTVVRAQVLDLVFIAQHAVSAGFSRQRSQFKMGPARGGERPFLGSIAKIAIAEQ